MVAKTTSPDCSASREPRTRAAAEREELEVHVELVAPPLGRRDRAQVAGRPHSTTAEQREKTRATATYLASLRVYKPTKWHR